LTCAAEGFQIKELRVKEKAMKKKLTTIGYGALLLGTILLATACPSNKPKTAVDTKPTPAPVTPAPERVVTAPPRAPETPVTASPIDGSIAELNAKGYLRDALFDYDKADLRDDARSVLAANADWLKKFSSVQVLIEGHCDERGTAAYNLALGDRRANAARDYLASLGVDASRIKTVSYGKERPICSDSNEGCWQRNRRAAFVITAK
jgi:peptidoglycan-associated lipoprotein